jgi:hypothetical protein
MARRISVMAFYGCLASLALSPTGCASSGLDSPTRTPGGQPYLGASEIRKGRFSNAYDAVRALRPLFLTARGPTSILETPPHDIVVIVNGQLFGGVEELRALPADEVAWLRRLSASDVYYKLGRSAPSGGIEVKTFPCSPGC